MTRKANRGRARIGVLVPFTNTNLESDLALLRPKGISFHFARLGGYDLEAIPDAEQMAGLGAADLEEQLRLIGGVRPDVVLYGCTSATLAHGVAFDQDLAQRIEAETGAATVTAAGALVHGLQSLGVRRLAFASPYVRALNDQAIAFLEESGFAVVSRADVPKDLGNYGQGEMTPEEVIDLATRADHPDAEAVVLSCTDLRSVETIEVLEARLKKPVVTSNQAMVFRAMEALGISPREITCGTLFHQSSIDPKAA